MPNNNDVANNKLDIEDQDNLKNKTSGPNVTAVQEDQNTISEPNAAATEEDQDAIDVSQYNAKEDEQLLANLLGREPSSVGPADQVDNDEINKLGSDLTESDLAGNDGANEAENTSQANPNDNIDNFEAALEEAIEDEEDAEEDIQTTLAREAQQFAARQQAFDATEIESRNDASSSEINQNATSDASASNDWAAKSMNQSYGDNDEDELNKSDSDENLNEDNLSTEPQEDKSKIGGEGSAIDGKFNSDDKNDQQENPKAPAIPLRARITKLPLIGSLIYRLMSLAETLGIIRSLIIIVIISILGYGVYIITMPNKDEKPIQNDATKSDNITNTSNNVVARVNPARNISADRARVVPEVPRFNNPPPPVIVALPPEPPKPEPIVEPKPVEALPQLPDPESYVNAKPLPPVSDLPELPPADMKNAMGPSVQTFDLSERQAVKMKSGIMMTQGSGPDNPNPQDGTIPKDGVIHTATDADSAKDSIVQDARIQQKGNVDYILNKGKIIYAVLETIVDTDVGGELMAIISQDVYSQSARNVLIPRGSRIFGTYNKGVVGGSNKVDISWQRIDLPSGYVLQLEGFSVDHLGTRGTKGDLDMKYKEKIANAVLTSTLGLGAAFGMDKLTEVLDRNAFDSSNSDIAKGLRSAAFEIYGRSGLSSQDKINQICTQCKTLIKDKTSESYRTLDQYCLKLMTDPKSTDAEANLNALINQVSSVADGLLAATKTTNLTNATKDTYNNLVKTMKDIMVGENDKPQIRIPNGKILEIYVNQDYRVPKSIVRGVKILH